MISFIVNKITSSRAGRLVGFFSSVDWMLLGAALFISLAGLLTMNYFAADNYFFNRQIIWILLSVVGFFIASSIDWRFLRRTALVISLFFISSFILVVLLLVGKVSHGAQSWFSFGAFSLQPSDFIKLVLIILLAKYFARRHIEIANFRHIIVSGLYALSVFVLVLVQPDFGSALVIFFIWFGMVLVSGISKKHLLVVLALGLLVFGGLWFYGFKDYQRQRIITFIHPLADIRGAGYNAYQSTIAVGSGRILGKGIGYGTQSKLQFLPEYETDFIFAAFAEEWGFVGVILLFALFSALLWRIIQSAALGASNFEIFFGVGLAVLFMAQIVINVGMNIGLLPVTGITLPFMSYGGSHLFVEFVGLGILTGMRNYGVSVSKDAVRSEVTIGG